MMPPFANLPDHLRGVLEPLVLDAERRGYERGVMDGKASGQAELLAGIRAIQCVVNPQQVVVTPQLPAHLSQPLPKPAEPPADGQATDGDEFDLDAILDDLFGGEWDAADVQAVLNIAIVAVREAADAQGVDPEPYVERLKALAGNKKAAERVMMGHPVWLAWMPVRIDNPRGKYQYKAVGTGDDEGKVAYGADAERKLRKKYGGKEGADPDADTVSRENAEYAAAREKARTRVDEIVKSLDEGRMLKNAEWEEFHDQLRYLTGGQLKTLRQQMQTRLLAKVRAGKRKADRIGNLQSAIKSVVQYGVTKSFQEDYDKLAGESVADEVKKRGGVDPDSADFKRFFDSADEAKQYGVATKKGGQPIDTLAESLVADGYLVVPDGQDPAEVLVDALRGKKKVIGADDRQYWEKEEERFNAEKAYEEANAEPAAEQELVGETAATPPPEDADTSFDFGANADEQPAEVQTEATQPAQDSGIDPQTQEAVQSVFGKPLDGDTVKAIGMVSGLSDAKVSSRMSNGVLELRSEGTDRNGGAIVSTRRIYRDKAGNLVCNNFVFESESQGKGVGTAAFASQIEALRKAGVDRIVTSASASPTENGYYTWPRMGYDGPLPDDVMDSMPPELKKQMGGRTNIATLMKTQSGRDWWKKNGTEIHLSFDTDPNSESSRTLAAYLEERKQRQGVNNGGPPQEAQSGGATAAGSGVTDASVPSIDGDGTTAEPEVVATQPEPQPVPATEPEPATPPEQTTADETPAEPEDAPAESAPRVLTPEERAKVEKLTADALAAARRRAPGGRLTPAQSDKIRRDTLAKFRAGLEKPAAPPALAKPTPAEQEQAEKAAEEKARAAKFQPVAGAVGTKLPGKSGRVQANDGLWYPPDQVEQIGRENEVQPTPNNITEGGDTDAKKLASVEKAIREAKANGEFDDGVAQAIAESMGMSATRVKQMHEDVIASDAEDAISELMRVGKTVGKDQYEAIAKQVGGTVSQVRAAHNAVKEQTAFNTLQDLKDGSGISPAALKKVAKDTGLSLEKVQELAGKLDNASLLADPDAEPETKAEDTPAPQPAPTPKKAPAKEADPATPSIRKEDGVGRAKAAGGNTPTWFMALPPDAQAELRATAQSASRGNAIRPPSWVHKDELPAFNDMMEIAFRKKGLPRWAEQDVQSPKSDPMPATPSNDGTSAQATGSPVEDTPSGIYSAMVAAKDSAVGDDAKAALDAAIENTSDFRSQSPRDAKRYLVRQLVSAATQVRRSGKADSVSEVDALIRRIPGVRVISQSDEVVPFDPSEHQGVFHGINEPMVVVSPGYVIDGDNGDGSRYVVMKAQVRSADPERAAADDELVKAEDALSQRLFGRKTSELSPAQREQLENEFRLVAPQPAPKKGKAPAKKATTPPATPSNDGETDAEPATATGAVSFPSQSKPDVTPEQQRALSKYKGASFDSLNKYLRAKAGGQSDDDYASGLGGGGADPKQAGLHVQDMQKMEATLRSVFGGLKPFDEPVTVYRGRPMRDASRLGQHIAELEKAAQTGEPITLPGYTSTSADPQVASDFARDGKGVQYVIAAKGGMDMSSLFPDSAEAELLLDNNSRFKVGKVEKLPNGGYRVQMEQVDPKTTGETTTDSQSRSVQDKPVGESPTVPDITTSPHGKKKYTTAETRSEIVQSLKSMGREELATVAAMFDVPTRRGMMGLGAKQYDVEKMADHLVKLHDDAIASGTGYEPEMLRRQGFKTVQGPVDSPPTDVDAAMKRFAGSMVGSGLSSSRRKVYEEATRTVLANMPANIRGFVDAHTGGVKYVRTTQDVMQARESVIADLAREGGATDAEVRKLMDAARKDVGDGKVGAFVVHGSGTKPEMVLDGSSASDKPTGTDDIPLEGSLHDEVYAHEFGHILDTDPDTSRPASQRAGYHSSSIPWLMAFANDIKKPNADTGKMPLSTYAAQSPSEGFAEFARLVYSGRYSLEEVAKKFPHAASYFRKYALWPDHGGTANPNGFRDVFDKRVPLVGPNHYDVASPKINWMSRILGFDEPDDAPTTPSNDGASANTVADVPDAAAKVVGEIEKHIADWLPGGELERQFKSSQGEESSKVHEESVRRANEMLDRLNTSGISTAQLKGLAERIAKFKPKTRDAALLAIRDKLTSGSRILESRKS